MTAFDDIIRIAMPYAARAAIAALIAQEGE